MSHYRTSVKKKFHCNLLGNKAIIKAWYSLRIIAESDICTFAARTEHFHVTNKPSTGLFTTDTRPKALRELYELAAIVAVRSLDSLRRDGSSMDMFLCTPVLGKRRRDHSLDIESRVKYCLKTKWYVGISANKLVEWGIGFTRSLAAIKSQRKHEYSSMPTKGGRRQREKRLRFQVKSALISNQDPFPYFQKLAQLLDQDKPVDSSREPVYTLNKLEVNLTFPSYKTIPKHDPRRFACKLRDLFGTGFKPAAIEDLRRWTSTEALGDVTVPPDCASRILGDTTSDDAVDHKLPSPEEQVQAIALNISKMVSKPYQIRIPGSDFRMITK
ncbi:hypothetical protein G5I_11653 [Acromyrmex echinatior]|uniref:Uncharacterized protein n=1 Tax=Acromyrmex echinatior TaxID=103372 RepID=F4X096_ACREC|nr:hypothetical protein G5I_11653 [Acromyrmex echinatior]